MKSAVCPGHDLIDAMAFQWSGFYRDVGNTTLISKGFQRAGPYVGHPDKAFKFSQRVPLCRRD
jgi:hypothetical protein